MVAAALGAVTVAKRGVEEAAVMMAVRMAGGEREAAMEVQKVVAGSEAHLGATPGEAMGARKAAGSEVGWEEKAAEKTGVKTEVD